MMPANGEEVESLPGKEKANTEFSLLRRILERTRIIRLLIFLEIVPLKLCPNLWGWLLEKLKLI